MRALLAASTALLSAAGASAATARHCADSDGDVCFQWGVPRSASSSGSKSNSGDVYFQISAPSDYQWAGLGIGQGMVGAEMFIIYQDGKGNVTLSTRKASSHSEPDYVHRAGASLIAGSGVQGGKMIANIKCSDCSSLDLSGENDWIAAWRSAGSLESTSTSADIEIHNQNAQFSVDMSQAKISSNSNPFAGSSKETTNDSGSGKKSDSDGDSDGGAVTNTSSASPSETILLAHGIVMTIAFAFLYPFGAMLMPLIGKWFVHSTVQILAFLTMWAGFGLGYYYADKGGEFFDDYHMKIGVITVALLGIQPILGWVHHWQYKRKQRRTVFSYVHIWYGRALMILGIINGGLGLHLQGGEQKFKIAYAIIAGVFGGLYIGSAIWGMIKRRRRPAPIKHIHSPSSGNSNERPR